MQENVAESLRFANENARQTFTLLEKAVELQRANLNGGEEECLFFAHTLRAMQTNAQIFHQTNAQLLSAWTELDKEVLRRVAVMEEEVNRAMELAAQPV